MTEQQVGLATATITTLGVLVGATIGAIVSYLIARQQFRASVLSTNRQQWINTLRDCISEFQLNATMLSTVLLIDPNKEQKYLEIMSRTTFLVTKSRLLINPEEDDHLHLIKLQETIMQLMHDTGETTDSRIGDLQIDLTSQAQKILKREWERVKEGK